MDESAAITISKNDSGVGTIIQNGIYPSESLKLILYIIDYSLTSFCAGKIKLKIMLVAKIPTMTPKEESVPNPISVK